MFICYKFCSKLVCVINENVNFFFFFLWLSSRSYVNYFNSKYQYIFVPNTLLRSITCYYLYEYLLIRASLEQNISLWLILVVINKDVTYIIFLWFVTLFVCLCVFAYIICFFNSEDSIFYFEKCFSSESLLVINYTRIFIFFYQLLLSRICD